MLARSYTIIPYTLVSACDNDCTKCRQNLSSVTHLAIGCGRNGVRAEPVRRVARAVHPKALSIRHVSVKFTPTHNRYCSVGLGHVADVTLRRELANMQVRIVPHASLSSEWPRLVPGLIAEGAHADCTEPHIGTSAN